MTRANTIVLEGGLGNRMRVAASAYAMTRRTGVPCRVLWTSQWGMHCRFDELFIDSPSALPVLEGGESFSLRDARGFEKIMFARPTWKNLHLPRLLQRLCYRRIIYAPQVWYLNRDGFDYERWFRAGGGLMTAYRDFCPWTSDDLRALFRPTAQVQALVDERTAAFGPHTIGLHIRRADHQQAIEESPLELFTTVVDRAIDEQADLRIYLATDDEHTKQVLSVRYGSRVIASPVAASRESSDGIREALVELLALSRTCHIYGSAGSTFSPIAACLGDVPITILQREGKGEVDLMNEET